MTCLLPYVLTGSSTLGVGPDAVAIERQQQQFTAHALDTPGTGALALSRITAVVDAAARASRPDWDGYGARPANLDSVRYAGSFLTLLPANYATPEVGVDPDGDVSLEWYASPERLFSISVSPRGELHYAGRFGKSRVRGKEALATAASSRVLGPYIERVSPL